MQAQQSTAVNATRNMSEDTILADLMSEMENTSGNTASAPVMSSGMIAPSTDAPAQNAAPETTKPAAKGKKATTGDKAPAVVVEKLPKRSTRKSTGKKATDTKDASATPETPAGDTPAVDAPAGDAPTVDTQAASAKPTSTPLTAWPYPSKPVAATSGEEEKGGEEEKDDASQGSGQAGLPEISAAPAQTAAKVKTDPALRNPFAKKSEKIMAKLGDKAADYLVLETADALLAPEELEAKRKALLAELDKTAKKVGEKAVMLFGWVRNGGKLNEYMHRAFKVLAQEGLLTSGIEGNLQKNYLARPYAPGTASAQANQIFQLFPALKMTVREKGRMVPNPDSVLLTTILTKLGLELKSE